MNGGYNKSHFLPLVSFGAGRLILMKFAIYVTKSIGTRNLQENVIVQILTVDDSLTGDRMTVFNTRKDVMQIEWFKK